MELSEAMERKLNGTVGSREIRLRIERARDEMTPLGVRVAFFIKPEERQRLMEPLKRLNDEKSVVRDGDDAIIFDNPTLAQFRKLVEDEAVIKVSLATILKRKSEAPRPLKRKSGNGANGATLGRG